MISGSAASSASWSSVQAWLPRPPSRPRSVDGELVRRAVAGDTRAEEALYQRHVRYIGGVAIRVLGRTADAEDVVQEAFLIAFTRMKQLREPGAFGGWVYRIALNLVRSRLRKRRLLRALGLDRGLDDASLACLASPETRPEVRAELSRIDRALDGLPAEHRLAWMLRHVEGWSLEEVAATLGCSLSTAKRRLREAADCIDEAVGGEPC